MTTTIPTLSPEICREQDGAVVRYILPPRQLGIWRVAGLLPLAFGVAFAAFPLGLGFLIIRQAGLGPAALGAVAFCSVFIIVGLMTARLGLLTLLPSHAEILITPTHLLLRDVAGPIRRTVGAPRHKIESLRVQTPGPGEKTFPIADYWLLTVTLHSGATRSGPCYYPADLLTGLAHALSRDLQVNPTLSAGAAPEAAIPVIVEGQAADSDAARRKPPQCAIDVARVGDALMISIPPSGFRGAARLSLVFDIMWLGFCLFFTVFMVAGMLLDRAGGNPAGGSLLALLMLLPFWAVGVAMGLYSWQMARRKAVLVINAESVVFTQTGPVRNSEKSWPRGAITGAAVGPSGVEINERPVLQVQLQLASGKHFGMLTGRPEPELYWVAGEIQRALGGA